MPYDKNHPEVQAQYNEAYYATEHETPEAGQRYSTDEAVAIANKTVSDKELAETLGRTVKAIEAKRQSIKKRGIVAEEADFVTPLKNRKGYISEEEANALMEAQEAM